MTLIRTALSLTLSLASALAVTSLLVSAIAVTLSLTSSTVLAKEYTSESYVVTSYPQSFRQESTKKYGAYRFMLLDMSPKDTHTIYRGYVMVSEKTCKNGSGLAYQGELEDTYSENNYIYQEGGIRLFDQVIYDLCQLK